MKADRAPAVLMLRAALAALFLLIVGSCGGGGSSTSIGDQVPKPLKFRSDLRIGYYWGCAPFMLEQVSHVNLWWATGYCNDPSALSDASPPWFLRVEAELQQARGAGIRNIVLHLPSTDIAQLRFEFARLSEGGYLAGWDSITLYPLDEPGSEQGGRKSDAEVTDIVTRIKQLALDIPNLGGAHVGVFYGCGDPKPGIKAYDRVGCFRYASDGCSSLASDAAALRAQMSPGAKLWLMPGGADIGRDGRQEPACWAAYAHNNADVWGVIPFIWQAVPDQRITAGIRSNGMRKAYCEMGQVMLNPSATPSCGS